MNSLEHQNVINDLNINTSKTLPPEYPQYEEREEQAEFGRVSEWYAVKESGAPDARGAPRAKKTASEKALSMAQKLKQLLTFVALIAAAAIIVPDIIPVLDLGAAELKFAEFYPEEDFISFSMEIETMSGDELTVIVQNDFIKEEASLILGEFHDKEGYYEGYVDYEDSSDYEEDSSSKREIYMHEEYYVSAGPDPTYHSVYGSASGLKPNMTYSVMIICGGKTLFSDHVTTGSGRSAFYSSSSSSH